MEEFSHIGQNTDYGYNYYQHKNYFPPLIDPQKMFNMFNGTYSNVQCTYLSGRTLTLLVNKSRMTP